MIRLFPALVVSVALPITVWAQAPAGNEFQVNTYTTNAQYGRAVASDASGNFVVVWASDGQDGSNFGIFGRRFNASGIPQGSEFQVNTYTTNKQYFPAVASDANGNFVVVWQSYGSDGLGDGVFARRFNAFGVPKTGEFRVNSYTTGNQGSPRVASGASGDFVIIWQSPQDGDGYGIFGQRFSAAGAAQGSEFRVSSYTTGTQFTPAVSLDSSGSFVVVWCSFPAQDGDRFGLFGQGFDAAGVPQGSEFRVNSYTTSDQFDPAVASDGNGAFMVVWTSFGEDGSYSGIFGQRFNVAGAPQGGEFQVNSYTTFSQNRAAITSDVNGNFVVAWSSFTQDLDSYGVFGQRLNASGARQGAEFRINSYTFGEQGNAGVASGSDGDFVVVWNSYAQDGSSTGIFGQRYGDIIFEDGFDSGDLSRWSTASTGGGDLSASGAAAMAGTGTGLQAFINDTGSLFVQDDTPGSESRYRVRFYFDPNGFDPGEVDSHFRTRILIAFDQAALRAITLVLKRQVGAYTVEARVKRNDGTRPDTGFFPITDGPHFLEFDWQRSTGPGASNGTLQFWIDGVSMTMLTGIDNDQSVIESVRMGALSIKTGANGTPYYDQFESRRLRQIGAE